VISRASSSILELEENLLQLHEYLTGFGLELDLEYTITNIVAYSKLHLPSLDLLTLANQLPSSSYDPSASISEHERPGCNVIVHALTDGKPRKTILVFSSSTITLTGFRSIPDIENQAHQFKRQLIDIIERHPEVKKQ
jgi:TATA-box binding protein (TBP) (component of TFIID and TFIIIB)